MIYFLISIVYIIIVVMLFVRCVKIECEYLGENSRLEQDLKVAKSEIYSLNRKITELKNEHQPEV